MDNLVTGASGFLGGHLVRSLSENGERVTVLSRKPIRELKSFVADLTAKQNCLLAETSFDRVYHLAGLAHTIAYTQEQRERFHQVNVEGTKNLLAALEHCRSLPIAFVMVSTVAVYGVERGQMLNEDMPRLATDAYGLSKREAEDIVVDWGARHGVRVGIVRLPLVAGRHAPGNLGAMVRGLKSRKYIGVGDGSARRSVVLAGNVAETMPAVAKAGGVFHLTDGHHPSFKELETALASALCRKPPRRLPLWAATLGARSGEAMQCILKINMPFTTHRLSKMISTLTFSDERARRYLNWRPARIVDHAAELVA